MVKMKNMLFPLLMLIGIGSAPTMWALSGAERARIKLELDKALQNDLPLSGKLIEQLRRGGEERLANEYAAKLERNLQDVLEHLIEIVKELGDIEFTVRNTAALHQVGVPGANAPLYAAEILVADQARAVAVRLLALADLLRKAKDQSLLGVWEQAVKAAVSQQLAVRALNEQVQDANAVVGVPKIRNAAAGVIAALRDPAESVNTRVYAAIRELNPVQRAAVIERVKEAASRTSRAAQAIIDAMR